MSNGIQLPYHRLRNNVDDVDASALRDDYVTIYAKDGVLYFIVDKDGSPVVILDALNSADVADLAGLLVDILLTTNKKIQFRDTGLYINSGADGKLTISSDGVGADDITLDGTITLTDNVTMPTSKKFILRSTGIFINSGAAGKLTIAADGSGSDDITLDGTVVASDLITASAGISATAQSITADAVSGAGATITAGMINVVVAGVANDANDWINLPPIGNVPIGHTIRIACNAGSNFEMRTPATTNTKINDVDSDGSQEYLCTDTDLVIVTKRTTTGWVAQSITKLGAVRTAVIPD